MAAMDLLTTRDTEADRVFAWRLGELERAGYDEANALELAERTDIDLHAAVQLTRRGCSVDIALRILL